MKWLSIIVLACLVSCSLPKRQMTPWSDCGVIIKVEIVSRSFNCADKIIITTNGGTSVFAYRGENIIAGQKLFTSGNRWKVQ